MKKTASKLTDAMTEIDINCDKVLAIINNLLDNYETCERLQPTIQHLTSACINSKQETSGCNTFNFVQGYNEIMQFIRIIFDYVANMSNTAQQAIAL